MVWFKWIEWKRFDIFGKKIRTFDPIDNTFMHITRQKLNNGRSLIYCHGFVLHFAYMKIIKANTNIFARTRLIIISSNSTSHCRRPSVFYFIIRQAYWDIFNIYAKLCHYFSFRFSETTTAWDPKPTVYVPNEMFHSVGNTVCYCCISFRFILYFYLRCVWFSGKHENYIFIQVWMSVMWMSDHSVFLSLTQLM